MMAAKLIDLARLARPRHWVKNVFVLAPIVFAMRMGDADAWGQVALAFAAFCLASSFAYVVNDIRDRRRDRLHPVKGRRPLAAGRISVPAAAAEAVVLLLASVGLAWRANLFVLGTVAAYILLQLAYSFGLKRKMLVDVIAIALGFVLRAVAGAAAIPVEASYWLIICTFTLCLFLGFCKRANELATLGSGEEARAHRATLAGYNLALLTQLITLSAAIAVVSFLLYATSPRTVQAFGTPYLVYTLPLIIYAIFRFAMLSLEGKYADPTDLIVHDWPFLLAAVLWGASAILIIRYGPQIGPWIVHLCQ